MTTLGMPQRPTARWIPNHSFLALLVLFSVLSSANSSAPWLTSPATNVLEEKTYRGLPTTVFAPSGRLYSVERAVEAAGSKDDASANLVVALRCGSGTTVVVSTATKSPHLDTNATSPFPLWAENDDDPERLPRAPLSRLAPSVWMITGGNAVDSSVLRHRIHRLADGMREANGDLSHITSSLSSAMVARRLADSLQVPTQTIGEGRILACSVLVLDPTDLWRIDPTGQLWKCHAVAVGRGAATVEANLLERVGPDVGKYLSKLSAEECIQMAVDCIGKVFAEEEESLHWQALILDKDGDGQVRHGRKISVGV